VSTMRRTGSSLSLPSSSPLFLRARAPVCRSNHPPLPRFRSSRLRHLCAPNARPLPRPTPFLSTPTLAFSLSLASFEPFRPFRALSPSTPPQAGPHLRGSSGSSESQAGRDRRRVEVRPPDLWFPRRGVGVCVGPFAFAPPPHPRLAQAGLARDWGDVEPPSLGFCFLSFSFSGSFSFSFSVSFVFCQQGHAQVICNLVFRYQ
jgi:hypothetical protein